MKNKNLPKTIPEAVDKILSKLSEKDKKTISNASKNDLDSFEFHHGLGTDIRNKLGLWSENKELLKACYTEYYKEDKLWLDHPDNASEVIIEAVWKKLRNNKKHS